MKSSFRVFDSSTGEVYPSHRIWAVAYEPIWQGVRLSCSFVDLDAIKSSCATLEAYMGGGVGTLDAQYRVFRAYNLMNALPIGQYNLKIPIPRIEPNEEAVITKFRDSLADRLMAIGKPIDWDWHTSRSALQRIKQSDAKFLDDLHRTLRYKRAGRPGAKPELRHFLNLLEEVRNG